MGAPGLGGRMVKTVSRNLGGGYVGRIEIDYAGLDR